MVRKSDKLPQIKEIYMADLEEFEKTHKPLRTCSVPGNQRSEIPYPNFCSSHGLIPAYLWPSGIKTKNPMFEDAWIKYKEGNKRFELANEPC